MFNLQANSFDIANGIRTDLDMQLFSTGLSVTAFNIMSFTYPEEIQAMINKNASASMVGDMGRYQSVAMTEGISTGKVRGGGVASDMAGMMMGMNMANQMMQNMNQNANQQTGPANYANNAPGSPAGTKPNFCPNCGQKTGTANFCPNCGYKLV
jgi:membrane protease subunit (stomatin/prohibitin family)